MLNKSILLRLHRWISLLFALPLAIVIVTGLLLSLQPILQSANIRPGSLSLERVEMLMDQIDPKGAARSIRIDTFKNTIVIGDAELDLTNGLARDDKPWLSEWMSRSRGIHEHLFGDLGWLVIASTIAMMVVTLLGILMGLPRLSHSLSGWHKATAWFLLPLVVLSPLTGLLMAGGVTFSQPAQRSPSPGLRDAVRMIADSYDLSGLEWIRTRGGRMLARVNDGNGQITLHITREGLKPSPANWPRTLHEGTFLGIWGGVMNLVLSLAFVLLLISGVTLWGRRALRVRTRARG